MIEYKKLLNVIKEMREKPVKTTMTLTLEEECLHPLLGIFGSHGKQVILMFGVDGLSVRRDYNETEWTYMSYKSPDYEEFALYVDKYVNDENKDEYPGRNPARWLIEWISLCKTCVQVIGVGELEDEVYNKPNGDFKNTVMFGCATRGDIPECGFCIHYRPKEERGGRTWICKEGNWVEYGFRPHDIL